MKKITMSYDEYVKEINESREKGYEEGLEEGTNEGASFMVTRLREYLFGRSELIDTYLERCCYKETKTEVLELLQAIKISRSVN